MGALETSLQAGAALGGLLAVGLLAVFGDRGALVVTGALLSVVALLALPALARLDQWSRTRDEDVALLSEIPLFGPLPLVGVEQLASRPGDGRSWPEGAEVVRTGDHADSYFTIEDVGLRRRAPHWLKTPVDIDLRIGGCVRFEGFQVHGAADADSSWTARFERQLTPPRSGGAGRGSATTPGPASSGAHQASASRSRRDPPMRRVPRAPAVAAANGTR